MFLILFFINLACLVFIIFIRIWSSKSTIRTTNKSKGIAFTNICLALLIICLIGCLIEYYALSYGINKANYPCKDKVKDDGYYYNYDYFYKKTPKNNLIEELRKLKNEYTKSECKSLGKYYYEANIPFGQSVLSYFSVSFLTTLSIIEIALWYVLKRRITYVFNRAQPVIAPVTQFGNQYGRDVVVIQPGDVVYMGGQQFAGPYVYNSGPYPQQPYTSNQVVANQYIEQIPNSNENQLRGSGQ
jgi:hypothetical protein